MANKMRARATALKPTVDDVVGTEVTIMGIKAKVIDIVPQEDYWWEVSLISQDGSGSYQPWTITVPTDFRTTDGHFAWDD